MNGEGSSSSDEKNIKPEGEEQKEVEFTTPSFELEKDQAEEAEIETAVDAFERTVLHLGSRDKTWEGNIGDVIYHLYQIKEENPVVFEVKKENLEQIIKHRFPDIHSWKLMLEGLKRIKDKTEELLEESPESVKWDRYDQVGQMTDEVDKAYQLRKKPYDKAYANWEFMKGLVEEAEKAEVSAKDKADLLRKIEEDKEREDALEAKALDHFEKEVGTLVMEGEEEITGTFRELAEKVAKEFIEHPPDEYSKRINSVFVQKVRQTFDLEERKRIVKAQHKKVIDLQNEYNKIEFDFEREKIRHEVTAEFEEKIKTELKRLDSIKKFEAEIMVLLDETI